jgi:phospholipid/cholesterol/gamma-HCH transport system substrate-binding protein
VLGTAVLALDPGTGLPPLVLPGGRISSGAASGDMGAVVGMVEELGGQISGILTEFQETQLALLAVSLETFNSLARKIDLQADAELDRISRILESTALITERTDALLREREGDINAAVTDLRGTLENIRLITADIRGGRGNLGQAVYDDRLYESALTLLDQVTVAAEKLQITLDKAAHLSETADTVIAGAGEIVEKAAGLGIQVDTGARYDFLAGGVRAGAAIRLDPRSNDRWYRIGVTGVPDGVGSRTVKETVTIGGANPGATVEDITETRYTVAVDAELARRFGALTIRGGLLESTAGLGLDFQPVRWMSLSGELFNFRNGAAPNLRGTVTFYPFFDPQAEKPWNWFYLRGGINDALNGEKRDFFLGGGLRYSDREVKGLVGLAPIFGN